jgi:hypothetical protein
VKDHDPENTPLQLLIIVSLLAMLALSAYQSGSALRREPSLAPVGPQAGLTELR